MSLMSLYSYSFSNFSSFSLFAHWTATLSSNCTHNLFYYTINLLLKEVVSLFLFFLIDTWYLYCLEIKPTFFKGSCLLSYLINIILKIIINLFVWIYVCIYYLFICITKAVLNSVKNQSIDWNDSLGELRFVPNLNEEVILFIVGSNMSGTIIISDSSEH